jgi:hypothetical protein
VIDLYCVLVCILYVMTHIHCVIVLLWCFLMLIASIRMYFDSIHSFIHLFHIPVDPNTGTQHHRIWNVSNISKLIDVFCINVFD